MLAINSTPSSSSSSTPTTSTRKLTPNLLPCTIKHTGPVPTPQRYWNPHSTHPPTTTTTPSPSGPRPISYFRGRKLLGRIVKVPEKYQGVVLEKTEKDVPRALKRRKVEDGEDGDEEEEEEEDDDEAVEIKLMEHKGTFDEVVVWGHEVVPECDDVYVKGVEEWMKVAEAMHFDRDHAA